MSTPVLTDFDLLMPASAEEALESGRGSVTVLSRGTDILVGMKGKFQADKVMSLAFVHESLDE